MAQEDRAANLADIDHYIAEHSPDKDAVTFYTTGHPYTWTEVAREELRKEIGQRC